MVYVGKASADVACKKHNKAETNIAFVNGVGDLWFCGAHVVAIN